MAGKSFTITIPRWTAGLLPNLVGLAGLVTICVMVAALTNWRWGGLLGGVMAVVAAYQMGEKPTVASNVVPHRLPKAAA